MGLAGRFYSEGNYWAPIWKRMKQEGNEEEEEEEEENGAERWIARDVIHTVRCRWKCGFDLVIKVDIDTTCWINSWLDILDAWIVSRDEWNAPLCPIVSCDEELRGSFSAKAVSIVSFDQSHAANKRKSEWQKWLQPFPRQLVASTTTSGSSLLFMWLWTENRGWKQWEPDIHFRMDMVTAHPVLSSLCYLTATSYVTSRFHPSDWNRN